MTLQPHWESVRDLFESIVDLPAEQAESILRECQADPDTVREVRQLLEIARQKQEFLESSQSNPELEVLEALASSTFSQVYRQSYRKTTDETDQHRLQEIRTRLQDAFPDFVVGPILGTGGQGTVFKGYDRKLQRSIALKVFTSRNRIGPMDSSFDEARATASINHANIATVYSVDALGADMVLVTQFIDGPNLKQWIAQTGFATPQDATRIAIQIASALSEAHRHGVIHRDIKPANILLQLPEAPDQSPQVHVIDFGLATRFTEPQTSTLPDSTRPETERPTRAGSLPYMAPEQWSSGDPTPAGDIYSLGVTLYQMTTGRVPFAGSPPAIIRQVLQGDPIPPRRINPEIPQDLESIILKAMALSPGDRYGSAQQFAADLNRFQNGESTVARPLTPTQKLRRWYRRDWKTAISLTVLAATLLLATLLTTALSYLISQKNRQLVAATVQTRSQAIQYLVDASPETLSLAITQLPADPSFVINQLQDVVHDPDRPSDQRFNAGLGLAHLGQTDAAQLLIDHVLQNPVSHWQVEQLVLQLSVNPENLSQARKVLQQSLHPLQTGSANPAQIRAALLNFYLGTNIDDPANSADLLTSLCQLGPDPTNRTATMATLRDFRPGIPQLANRLSHSSAPIVAYTFLCGLSWSDDFSLQQIPASQWQELLNAATTQFPDAPEVTAAAIWLARQHQVQWEPPPAAVNNANRFDIGHRLQMVRIPAGSSRLGTVSISGEQDRFPPFLATISQDFFLSDTEVSRSAFQEFLSADDQETIQDRSYLISLGQMAGKNAASPSDEHPIVLVSWNAAAAFCNWLSRTHGLQPAYEIRRNQQEDSDGPGHYFELNKERNGFRLPTECQWEYAARAHSETDYFFGEDHQLARRFITASSRRAIPASVTRSTFPNPFGLFETVGNVWEWTNDWHSIPGTATRIDWYGPAGPADDFGKVFRGGGVNSYSGEPVSHSRGFGGPNQSYDNLGFRIACPIATWNSWQTRKQ